MKLLSSFWGFFFVAEPFSKSLPFSVEKGFVQLAGQLNYLDRISFHLKLLGEFLPGQRRFVIFRHGDPP